MWEWIARLLIPLGYTAAMFCFIVGAFRSLSDYAKAACIVAAICALVQLLKFEIQ